MFEEEAKVCIVNKDHELLSSFGMGDKHLEQCFHLLGSWCVARWVVWEVEDHGDFISRHRFYCLGKPSDIQLAVRKEGEVLHLCLTLFYEHQIVVSPIEVWCENYISFIHEQRGSDADRMGEAAGDDRHGDCGICHCWVLLTHLLQPDPAQCRFTGSGSIGIEFVGCHHRCKAVGDRLHVHGRPTFGCNANGCIECRTMCLCFCRLGYDALGEIHSFSIIRQHVGNDRIL